MRIHIKLLLLFLIACMFLLGVGLIANAKLRHQAENQVREHLHTQLTMTAIFMQDQLDLLDEQLINLSVSDQVNLFSLYDRTYNMGEIVEKSKSLFWQMQVLRGSFPFARAFFIMMPEQERQITDQIRYETLDWELYTLLSESPDSVVMHDGDLHISLPVSTARLTDPGALVGVTLDAAQLLSYVTIRISTPLNVRLLFQGESLAMAGADCWAEEPGSLEWSEDEQGYGRIYPLQLTSRGQMMMLEVFVDRSAIGLPMQSYYVWTLIQIALALAELILFMILLRQLISDPLQKLIHAFDQLARGVLTVNIRHEAQDEFADLYAQFNETVKRLNETLMLKYKAELKQLQSQIHPHFLYNAFYQLYRICRMENADEAAAFALLLSRYYGYITRVSREDGLVTLMEEYEHARRYGQIQHFRYGEWLSLQFTSLSEEAKKLLVPKMLIQPLVENAIKHCFERNQDHTQLTVTITSMLQGDRVHVIVEDNGNGLSDADIKQLNEKLTVAEPRKENSGLVNVHLRLRCLHPQGGVQLSRSPEGGLRAELFIYPENPTEINMSFSKQNVKTS